MYNAYSSKDVNTLKYSGKSKSRYTKSGIINGRTNAYKKAIVPLKEGDTIDFYSNILWKDGSMYIYSPQHLGQRHKIIGTFEEITASVPEKSLVFGKRSTGGRNNVGKMTMRYMGGGHKRKYRLIDFKKQRRCTRSF